MSARGQGRAPPADTVAARHARLQPVLQGSVFAPAQSRLTIRKAGHGAGRARAGASRAPRSAIYKDLMGWLAATGDPPLNSPAVFTVAIPCVASGNTLVEASRLNPRADAEAGSGRLPRNRFCSLSCVIRAFAPVGVRPKAEVHRSCRRSSNRARHEPHRSFDRPLRSDLQLAADRDLRGDPFVSLLGST